MSWFSESRRHSLASKGVKTSTSAKVNLNRYTGKWFDVGHYPQWFQSDCVTSIAEYKKDTDDTLIVKNTCIKKDGTKSTITGDATVISEDTLGVSFFPLIRSPYKIEWVDKDYKKAIVGHPQKKNLWLLSRNKTITKKELETLKNIAKKKGYSPSKLTKVKTQ